MAVGVERAINNRSSVLAIQSSKNIVVSISTLLTLDYFKRSISTSFFVPVFLILARMEKYLYRFCEFAGCNFPFLQNVFFGKDATNLSVLLEHSIITISQSNYSFMNKIDFLSCANINHKPST